MSYSFHRHLLYLGWVFSRPRTLVCRFCGETSPLYGIVSFALRFLVLDELLYIQSWRANAQPVSPLPAILPIPQVNYYGWVALLAPLVNLLDVLLFAGVFRLAAVLPSLRRISAGKTTAFFLLVGCALGFVSAAADLANQYWNLSFLSYIHPIVGLVAMVYLVGYVRMQAGISWWKAGLLSLVGVLVFLVFRNLLFR